MSGEDFKICRKNSSNSSEDTCSRNCLSIKDYIQAVKEAEKIYPAINPPDMVTALRKLWCKGEYNTLKWDRFLEDANTNPFNLSSYFNKDFRYRLKGIQCLWTDTHGCIDFGHVLAGVDGTNYPGTLLPGFSENPDLVTGCVTWAGDVGSAYDAAMDSDTSNLQKTLIRLKKKNPNATLEDAAFHDMASHDDLLGDVDGVVLGRRMKQHRKQGKRQSFSSELRDYYLGSNPLPQTKIFDEFVNTIYKPLNWPWAPYAKIFSIYPDVLFSFGRWKDSFNQSIFDGMINRWRQFLNEGLKGTIKNEHNFVRALANWDRKAEIDQE